MKNSTITLLLCCTVTLLLCCASCTPAGSVITSDDRKRDAPFLPYINKYGDTIDFCLFYPMKDAGLWIGTNRQRAYPTTNMTYSTGKTHTSVIIINDSIAEPKIIKGKIISETDKIVVIEKSE